VAHGRAIPLLWQTLEHPSASVSASVSIALLEKADQLLAGFGAITLLADPVTARKDDAPAAVQAAIVNVAGLNSSSAGGGLIQTTSG
jgi:hypothetical protein